MAAVVIIGASVFGWIVAMIAFLSGTDIWTTMLIYLAISIGGTFAVLIFASLRQTESGRAQ